MLYITNNEDSILPEKFFKINNLCALIYDQITEIGIRPEYRELLKADILIEPSEQLIVEKLLANEIDPYTWLKENNRSDKLNEIIIKNLVLAILSDFANFTYESLSCAKRGKIVVAYSLLRKPFMDELLLLEQLLFDAKEFSSRFSESTSSKDYDPSQRKLDKKEIIISSIAKLEKILTFNADFIFDLRYNKEMKGGLNGISNQAIHIVTQDSNYRTNEKELNFVFSAVKEIDRYWEHYYNFVPYLLIYCASVVDGIVFEFLKNDIQNDIKAVKAFRRLIALLFFSQWTSEQDSKPSEKMFKLIIKSLKIKCDDCKKEISLVEADFELFLNTESFLCPTCFKDLLANKTNIEEIRSFMFGLN